MGILAVLSDAMFQYPFHQFKIFLVGDLYVSCFTLYDFYWNVVAIVKYNTAVISRDKIF